MIKRSICVAVALLFTVSSVSVFSSTMTTTAGEYLIKDRHWNERTKTWLARAMVSEAGWEETNDHVAIAYVLYRRWQLAKKRFPRFKLIAIIKRYCAGFRDNTVFTPRQKWVKNLSSDARRPSHWPNDIHWKDYKERWKAVLDVAEKWRQGEFADPCGGIAMYWGGPMDRPSKRMIKMDCGETQNTFYTVEPLVDKRLSKVMSKKPDNSAIR